MDNNDYKSLEEAKRIILDEKLDALDKIGIKVVSSKVETHPRYGPQCVIILQSS